MANSKDLEDIISAHYNDIYKFCCWKTHNHIQAQDITQDTFIRFMNSVDSFADIKKPKALLYTIAKNLCLNWLNTKQPLSLDAQESPDTPAEDDFANESVQKICLSDAVSTLPDDQQEILLLRYGQDLKVSEIAEILGLSRFQVMYRERCALDRLRKTIRKEDLE